MAKGGGNRGDGGDPYGCNESHIYNDTWSGLRDDYPDMEEERDIAKVCPVPPIDIGLLMIGVIFTLAGACCLAFSMTVQRYALAHPKEIIPYCGLHLRRKTVWSVGLLLYIAANGLKVVALNFGPMTVLSSLFTTLLVFNLVIANKLLDEEITPPKVVGAFFIVAGAGVCSIATPKGVPSAYNPEEVRELFGKSPPFGWFLILIYILVAISAVVMIVWFEHTYPIGVEGQLKEEVIDSVERRMSVHPMLLIRQPPSVLTRSNRINPDVFESARIEAEKLAEERASRRAAAPDAVHHRHPLSWRSSSKISTGALLGTSTRNTRAAVKPMASIADEGETSEGDTNAGTNAGTSTGTVAAAPGDLGAGDLPILPPSPRASAVPHKHTHTHTPHRWQHDLTRARACPGVSEGWRRWRPRMRAPVPHRELSRAACVRRYLYESHGAPSD